ncbi:MAG: tetratricopeptide repeat protein [Planctomycetes bacterium]|nr:tetratricopeptide repeat protein [Planctomycetota bacterium]
MKRLLLLVLSGSAVACGAAEVGDPPPAASAWAATAEPSPPPAMEPLDGTEFLPPPLRPTDPALSSSDSFLGAMKALREEQPRVAALALVQAQRELGQRPDLAALQSWALLASGDAGDAARVARSAAEVGSLPAQYALARALHQAGDRAGAHVWFERCRGRLPGPEGFLPWAAESALAAKAPAAALRDLDPMLLDGPLAVDLGLIRARALAMAGRLDEAVSQFDQLLQDAAGQDPAVWNETGAAVFRDAIDHRGAEAYARAARYFRRATELDPQEPRYRFNLACAQDWGGDPVEAEASYERALELRPGYLEAFENLVILLLAGSRQDDALAAQRQMLRQPLSPSELQRVLAAVG